MANEIDNERIKDAWDRIARTQDGVIAYRHLQRIRLGIVTATADLGALQINEGRRSLAADLMAFMAEGVADNDRACITFAVAKPVAVAGTGTDARRKWLASQSWYDNSQTGGAGSSSTGSNGTGSSSS